MGSNSTSTFFSFSLCKFYVEGKVIDLRFIRYVCNLPIKKHIQYVIVQCDFF